MKRSMSGMLVAVLTALLFLTAGPAWADSKKITSAIDEASQSCRGVSQQIWDLKELGQQEAQECRPSEGGTHEARIQGDGRP